MGFENINIRQIVSAALSYDAIIVDVRPEKRFREGHIPLAINVPMERVERGQINLPKSRVIIVYCDTGGSSIRAAGILSRMGYKVINCVGGLKNYKASLTK